MRARLGRAGLALALWWSVSADTALAGRPFGGREVTLPVAVAPDTLRDGFGILARETLVEPRLGERLLVEELPAGAALRFRPEGTLLFSYVDLLGGRLRASWLRPADDPDMLDLRAPGAGPAAPALIAMLRGDGPERLLHFRAVDALLWSGDLVLRFDFGRRLRDFRLTAGARGNVATRIGAFGPPVSLALSADGTSWITVWRAGEPADDVAVEASLPPALRGSRRLWLRLRSEEAALHALALTAELEASDLLPPAGGPLPLRTAGGARALLFGPGEEPPRPGPEAGGIRYPAKSPEVREDAGRIRILFPNRTGIELRRAGEGVAGIATLVLADRPVLDAPPDALSDSALALEIVAPGTVGGLRDWKAYLRQREAAGMRWPRLGGRSVRTVALSEYTYLGAEVADGEVVLRFAGGGEARLALAFAALSEELDGRQLTGLAWQLRAAGIPGAVGLRTVEQALVQPGGWSFQQLWGRWVERRADFVTPFALPRRWYFADAQPFHFEAGPGGTRIATFDRPVAALVAVEERAGRMRIEQSVPLAAGEAGLRVTPWRIWLADTEPVRDRWTALDRWTAVYEALAAGWREALGLGRSEVRPILWHSHGFEPRSAGAAGPDYFAGLAGEALEIAEAYGFPRFLIDGPWESDWGHEAAEYLPGSAGFGSANAPWRLVPEPALGGTAGLRRLAEAARARGIELLLWTTPGHLSNSSPLFVEHPDWVRFRVDGRPEDADYGDITGTAMDGGWFDYATRAVADLAATVPMAGFLVDSWLTFGVYPDARARAPVPALDRSIALQKSWRHAGLSTVLLEGVGPFGVSGGGFGAELLSDPQGAPLAEAAFAGIRGREYGLYRYVADTVVEPESYYRALAAGGAVSVNLWQFVELLDEPTREAVGRANRDHAQVRDLMQRRHLIGRGEEWLGVSWSSDATDTVALFAFARFALPTEGRDRVLDVTTGERLRVSGTLRTEPFHTYRLQRP